MDEPDSRVAEAWLIYQRHWWPYEALETLLREEPDRAWQIILAMLGEADADTLIDRIGAGPLEDLLERFGPMFVDRIEAKIRDSTRLASALRSVWLSDGAVDAAPRLLALGCQRVSTNTRSNPPFKPTPPSGAA